MHGGRGVLEWAGCARVGVVYSGGRGITTTASSVLLCDFTELGVYSLIYHTYSYIFKFLYLLKEMVTS